MPDTPQRRRNLVRLPVNTPAGYRHMSRTPSRPGAPVAALKDLAPKKTGYFSIPVPPGQDGRLWKLNRSAHFVVLLTVPACLARNANELLLPREVVAADASGGNWAR